MFYVYELWRPTLKHVALKANSHIPCRFHAVPLPCRSAKGLDCVFPHLIYTVRSCLIHTCHAVPLPCHDLPFRKRSLKATAQRGMRTAWFVWISIGRPQTACGRPVRFRLLPATSRSSTKVVTGSRLAVRIFPSTTRTFTKDTALSENNRVAAWHVWINAAGERHGKWELSLTSLWNAVGQLFCVLKRGLHYTVVMYCAAPWPVYCSNSAFLYAVWAS
jgi:hypothetical protein